jgi:hypothetical protein
VTVYDDTRRTIYTPAIPRHPEMVGLVAIYVYIWSLHFSAWELQELPAAFRAVIYIVCKLQFLDISQPAAVATFNDHSLLRCQ